MTGTSGRVGAAIAAALDAAGWAVRGVDRVTGQWTGVVGDLRDPGVRRAALHGCDLVIHAAALHAPHVGRVDDEEFRAVNVGATEALLEEAGRARVRRVVYISSTSVYGHALVPTDRAVWVDEGLPPRPRDIYDETKLAAERLVASSALTPVVLRIARCFPEPPRTLAVHLLHRAVGLSDVAAAAVRVAEHDTVARHLQHRRAVPVHPRGLPAAAPGRGSASSPSGCPRSPRRSGTGTGRCRGPSTGSTTPAPPRRPSDIARSTAFVSCSARRDPLPGMSSRRRIVSSISAPRPLANPRSVPVIANPARRSTLIDPALSLAARANTGRTGIVSRSRASARPAMPCPQ
nr:hypothetical protein GCM10020092_039600 [Actinoplanes digitatis]